MKEFIKRLVRFIAGLFTVLCLPVVFITELVRWAFDSDDAFDCFDGLGGDIFEVLTFSLFADNE